MGFFSLVGNFFRNLWNMLCEIGKAIYQKIVSFAKNVVSFFQKPSRLEQLKQHEGYIATVVKENLDNGNVRIINCLYDKNKEKVVNYEEDAYGYECEQMDPELARNFGNKDMIILQ